MCFGQREHLVTTLFIRGAGLAALTLLLPIKSALPHGFAGDRFFPATILTDDPFVADEASLPTITRNPTAADGTQEVDIGVDFAKRILPDLGITIGREWKYVQSPGVPAVTGFGALETGLQYQLFINAPHEVMALAGVSATWGHTGRVQALGEPDFTTLTPTFNWGKGFGDLPDSLPYLRPFAVTGNLSVDFPTKVNSNGNLNSNNLNYGFAIEYSLEYLQHHVLDIGIGRPFDRLTPLVEVALTTPLNRGQGSLTTGTVQPGLIWSGEYYQIGAEMIIPVNSLSGHGIGGVVQFHAYLDDLFPKSIGKPLFGY
jgi:hypothetical protein